MLKHAMASACFTACRKACTVRSAALLAPAFGWGGADRESSWLSVRSQAHTADAKARLMSAGTARIFFLAPMVRICRTAAGHSEAFSVFQGIDLHVRRTTP